MDTILRKQYMRLIISIIVCLLVGAVLVVVLFRMKSSFDSANSLKGRLTSYQINKKAFNEEAIQINSLQKRLSFLEGKIFNNSSVPQLLSSLEAQAASKNVRFEITSVQTIVDGDNKKLVIECDTVGSYEQVTSFFSLLEHQDFQVRFKQLSLLSEKAPVVVTEVSGTLTPNKPKTPAPKSEIKWRGIATIEVISFE